MNQEIADAAVATLAQFGCSLVALTEHHYQIREQSGPALVDFWTTGKFREAKAREGVKARAGTLGDAVELAKMILRQRRASRVPKIMPALTALPTAQPTYAPSQLEYFAARAPAEPQAWFEPNMPPRPKKNPAWKWCDWCKNDAGECQGTANCDQLRAAKHALDEWAAEKAKQRYTQWPWAWANAVLDAGGRPNIVCTISAAPVHPLASYDTAKFAAQPPATEEDFSGC